MSHLLVACCLAFLFASNASHAETLDKIVAVVNGDVITQSLLENQLRTEDYSVYGEQLRVRRMALEHLIDWKLMLQEAARYGKGFVLEEDIQRERDKWVKTLPPGVEFGDELERLGLVLADVNETIRERIIIRDMSFSKFFEVVSDEDADEYYEAHPHQYLETRVRLEQIYFRTELPASGVPQQASRQLAETLLSLLQDGATLARLSADFAGDARIIFISEEETTLESRIPALSNAVARLEVGQWSHVVRTPVGLYLVRLLERFEPRQKEFSEVKDFIKDVLLAQGIDRRRQKWLTNTKKDADIRILDPPLAAIPVSIQSSSLPSYGNP